VVTLWLPLCAPRVWITLRIPRRSGLGSSCWRYGRDSNVESDVGCVSAPYYVTRAEHVRECRADGTSARCRRDSRRCDVWMLFRRFFLPNLRRSRTILEMRRCSNSIEMRSALRIVALFSRATAHDRMSVLRSALMLHVTPLANRWYRISYIARRIRTRVPPDK
jgi:hypothetical protein